MSERRLVDAHPIAGGLPAAHRGVGQGSGRAFRAVPSQIQPIQNNLSIANMDFDFRGIPES